MKPECPTGCNVIEVMSPGSSCTAATVHGRRRRIRGLTILTHKKTPTNPAVIKIQSTPGSRCC